MSVAIEVSGLRHRYPGPSAPAGLHVPAFRLGAGASLALRGDSGCGKTTFLHLLAGILPAASGEIRIAGEVMTEGAEATRDRRRARLLGLVFQTFNLLQGFTIQENLEITLRFAGTHESGRIRALLERLEIADCARRFPRELSTGQQQRVALARALIHRPALVLADEPTASLDSRLAATAATLLRELCSENGAALLLVTHDERALACCDHVRAFADLQAELSIP